MIMFRPLSAESPRSTGRRSASSTSKLIGCPVYCFWPEPGTSVLKVGCACTGGVAGGGGGWGGGRCARRGRGRRRLRCLVRRLLRRRLLRLRRGGGGFRRRGGGLFGPRRLARRARGRLRGERAAHRRHRVGRGHGGAVGQRLGERNRVVLVVLVSFLGRGARRDQHHTVRLAALEDHRQVAAVGAGPLDVVGRGGRDLHG